MTKQPNMRVFKQEKLWRDKLPARLESQGSRIHVQPINDEQFDYQLRIKLVEEAHEIEEAASLPVLIQELADLYEVVDTLLALHGITKDELHAAQDKKRAELGGFMQRTFVSRAEHPAGSYSEIYCLERPDIFPEII
jgi:predicted house-cleaning noncanonical NTP pyrophosphatase (MazG superfamily)